MKKILAVVVAVIMLTAMTTFVFAANAKTIEIPYNAGLEMSFSDIGDKWGKEIASTYGTYNLLVAEAGSTIVFSKDVQFNSMGAPSIVATAGTTIKIEDIDGNYFYADDGILYTMIVSSADTMGVIAANGAALTSNTSDLAVAAAPAPDPDPVTAPDPDPVTAPDPDPVTAAPDPDPISVTTPPPAAIDDTPAPSAGTTPVAPISVPVTGDSDMVIWALVGVLALAGVAFAVKTKKTH